MSASALPVPGRLGVLRARFAHRRPWFVSIALLAFALLCAALFMQHVVGLEPCPLCILQRYALIGVMVCGGLAAALATRGAGTLFGVLMVISALAGAGVAAWQSNLQRNPPEFAACGPGLHYMLSELPWTRAWPRIFAGSGDCTDPSMRIIGLSLAEWSLIGLVVIIVAGVMALRRPRSL